MKWQLLNVDEAAELYNKYMVGDFPGNELKPFTAIDRMMQEYCYKVFAVREDDGSMVAYVCLCLCGDPLTPLLDYYGVVSDKRGRGYGTRVLQELPAHCSEETRFICIEAEEPATAPNPEAATRRIAFYRRAGCIQSIVQSEIFGVHYCNFILRVRETFPSAMLLREALQATYKAMVTPEQYQKNVSITGGGFKIER